MTSEMRPTDDELEAMAVRFEQDHWFDAAAMLRACKGYDHSEWGAISFLADHNGEAYLREMKFRKAAEQAIAEMTRRRDHWKALAEGQDFTRVYLETCAERDAHKARAEAAEAQRDALKAENARLQDACHHVSLIEQDTSTPAHVKIREAARYVRAALRDTEQDT